MSMNPEHKQRTKMAQLDLSLERQEDQIQVQQVVQAPQEEVQQERRLDQDVQALQTESVSTVSGPLFSSSKTFDPGEANSQRQQNPEQIERSKKKAGRKAAAADQAKADAVANQRVIARRQEYNTLATVARTQFGMITAYPEHVVAALILESDDRIFSDRYKEEERVDVTGYLRRKNEKKFAKESAIAPSAKLQSSASKDVENLCNNMYRDLLLEGDTSVPEELSLYKDAFYFGNLCGEDILKGLVQSAKKLKETVSTNPPPERVQALEDLTKQYQQLSNALLEIKNLGANDSVQVIAYLKQLKAYEMARRQITDEITNPYHPYRMEMLRILDLKTLDLRAIIQKALKDMQTMNGTVGTPAGVAKTELIHRLAELRRQMPPEGGTPEQEAALRSQANEIFRTFHY